MKNSGIEWVGEIPDNWEISRLKYLFTTVSGNGFNIDLQGEEGGDYPFCKASDISVAKKVLYKAQNYVTKHLVKLNRYNIIPTGSIIFAKIGEAMKKNNRAICQCDCCIDNNCQALIPLSNILSAFAFYILKCVDMQWFDNAGTIPCISVKKLMNSSIVFPPLSEQKAIAEFLDKKCGEVDALITDIQQEIETLEQYKRSVITEAVTKGLDPSVPMKDSGIDWVQTIPKHWSVHPLYYYFEERKNKNIFAKEQNLLSLSYGKIIRKDINASGGLLPENFNAYNIVEPKDIVLRLTDLQNDRRSLRTGYVNERGIITSAYITLKAKRDIIQEYFYYELHVFDLMKGLYNMGSGVRQGLNFDELSKLKLFEPSIKEQEDIVIYIKEKEIAINKIIADKQSQIETLESYKKSLIYEYVTGKKEVG